MNNSRFLFVEVSGKERYQVKDLITGGVRYDDTMAEMLQSCFYFRFMGHDYQVTDTQTGDVTTIHLA